MRHATLLPLIALAANVLFAQQADTSPGSKTTGTPSAAGSSDAVTMAAAIRDSYYHPDELSALDCAVSINWTAFLASMKLNPPAGRLKAIQGLNIRSQAVRGKTANLTFDWTGGALANKEQLEDSARQMLSGFYQMYWSLIASPPIHNASEISKIERLPDGGAKVYSISESINVVITVDKEDTPTHYALDGPLLTATVDLHYIPSPNPAPGDVRRISGMDVAERIGASNLNIKLNLDYQPVGEFYVPANVSYNLGGAYSLSTEFSRCSVSKVEAPDKSGGR